MLLITFSKAYVSYSKLYTGINTFNTNVDIKEYIHICFNILIALVIDGFYAILIIHILFSIFLLYTLFTKHRYYQLEY